MATPTPTAAPKPLDPAYVAESNTVMIVTVVTIFHFLALIFVSLRIYARAVVIKTFGKDDICMVLSAVCCSSLPLGNRVANLCPVAGLCDGRMDCVHDTVPSRTGKAPGHPLEGGQYDHFPRQLLAVHYLDDLVLVPPEDVDRLQSAQA